VSAEHAVSWEGELPESLALGKDVGTGFSLVLPLLIVALLAIIEVTSYSGNTTVCYALVAVGMVTCMMSFRLGVGFFIAVLLLSDDTPRTLEMKGFASVHTVQLLGVGLSAAWLLALAGWVMVRRLFPQQRSRQFWGGLPREMGVLCSLLVISGFVGMLHGVNDVRIAVSDASFFVGTLAAFVVLAEASSILLYVRIVLYALFAKAVLGAFHFYTGEGLIVGENVRPLMDSSKNLFPILVLAPLLGWAHLKSKWIYSLLGILSLLLGLFHLISFANRGNMMLSVFAVLILGFAFLRGNVWRHKRSKVITSVAWVGLAIFAAITVMEALRPGSTGFLEWKLQSILPESPEDWIHAAAPSSSTVRALEGVNIWGHLWDVNDLPLGKGLGGWFSDETFPYFGQLFDRAAYRSDWIASGKVYKPHEAPLFILLKCGLVGLLAYLWVATRCFLVAFKTAIRSHNANLASLSIGVAAMLPLLFLKNYNTKMQIVLGLALACLSGIIAGNRFLRPPDQVR
jgi:hypothetical protein